MLHKGQSISYVVILFSNYILERKLDTVATREVEWLQLTL